MFAKSFVRKIGFEKEVKTLIVRAGKLGEDLTHLYKKPNPRDSILLAGSGRSGTTWLGDLIAGSMKRVQQIFEPIHPMINAEVRELTGFDESDPCVRSFYLRPPESRPEWETLWRRILTGEFRNYWTDYHKRWSYFPNTYLIKEIRANLMLGFINAHLKPRIILIMRHPCGVVYSRLAKVRKMWQASVRDILGQEQLVHDYLLPWVKDLEHEDELVGAHAAWWAIENYVALKQLSNTSYHFLTYEDLAMNPTAELIRLFKFLEEKEVKVPQSLILKPSRLSSEKGGRESNVMQNIGSWKSGLDRKDQFKILDWAHKFGLTLYNEQTLPMEFTPPGGKSCQAIGGESRMATRDVTTPVQ